MGKTGEIDNTAHAEIEIHINAQQIIGGQGNEIDLE